LDLDPTVLLEHVLTEVAYRHMIPLAERFEAETKGVMEKYHLPWHVTRVGCRVEYLFREHAAKNGSEAMAGQDGLLEPLIHLYMLNRGVLLTPFHNMALMSPVTTEEHVRKHTEVLEESIKTLIS
jgi:glutamate-1-semialdehyde 2,1-aminomutase